MSKFLKSLGLQLHINICTLRALFCDVQYLLQMLSFWSELFFSPQDCPSGSGSRSGTTAASAAPWNPCTPLPSGTRGVGMLPQSTALNSPHTPGAWPKALNKKPPFLCLQMFLLKVRSKIWAQKFILLQPPAPFIPGHQMSQVTAWQ